MNLVDLVNENMIVTDIEENTKEGVLRVLVEQMVDLGEVVNADEVLQALLEREQLMTTGVRTNCAIPHAFSEHVRRSLVVLGYAPGGADWQALDNEPVHYVFLMLGPPEARGAHLRLLAHISRLLSSKVFIARLMQARTPAEFYRAIEAAEVELAFQSEASESKGGQ